MMRTFLRVMLTLVAILVIVGIVLTTIAALFFGGEIADFFTSDSKSYARAEKTITMSAAQLDTLSIDLINANVTVKTADTDTATITYMQYENGEIIPLNSGGVFGLKEEQKYKIFNFKKYFNRYANPVTITLPSSTKAEADLSVVNGKIVINGCAFSDVKLNSVNGDIELSSVVSDSDIKITEVNGEISAEKATASKISLNTVNGEIEALYLTCPDIRCETVNGDIKTSVYGEADSYSIRFNSVNGNIFIDGSKYGKDVDINAKNGTNNAKFNTVNGKAQIDFINQ